jgi:hypothetical protein
MEFVHRCHFCGWQREASSPTILEPRCEGCGSLLDSGRVDDSRTDLALEPRFVPSVRLSPRLARGLRLSTFGTVLLTAAATGLQAGGPWMALGALGAAGLAVTPALIRG